MEKELFESIIKLCVLMSTEDRTEYKNSPLWKDIEATINKYQNINPNCKVDVDYDRVIKHKAAREMLGLNSPNSGTLKIGLAM